MRANVFLGAILIPEYLDFHSGYSAPRSRRAGIYSGIYPRIYSYSGISQTNAPLLKFMFKFDKRLWVSCWISAKKKTTLFNVRSGVCVSFFFLGYAWSYWHFMTFFCSYFSLKLMVKLTRKAMGHFVTRISTSKCVIKCNAGQNCYLAGFK